MPERPVRDVLVRTVRAAATAEVCWTEDAAPAGRPVVPLLDVDHPVLAVPYADVGWARSLGTRPRIVLTLSDPRLAASGWAPLAVTAVPRLVEDRDGEVFVETLLDQELRKHPPSRALADSPLLRREHWWYLPRLLVHLDVLDVQPFTTRTGPDDALLVTVDPGAVHVPQVRPVHVSQWGSPLQVEPLDGEPLPDAGTAMLLGHDFTEPDLERWASWTAVGPLRDGVLDAEPPAGRTVPGMPGLRERVRRHKELRRACEQGLRLP